MPALFGRDRETFKIRAATVTHGGYINISSENNPVGINEYIGDADAQAEASLRYGLLETFEVTPIMLDAISTIQQKEALQAKADKMKAAANNTP